MITGCFFDLKLEQVLHSRAPQLQKVPPKEDEPPKQKVIVLAGPTGCGKSDFAMLLAKNMKGEILSADSMQVYRGMDIGTAKPTKLEQQEIPHHLIDIRDVADPMNVVQFTHEATGCLERFRGREEIPIVVGGSGFYLHSLLYGPPSGPAPCPELRKELEERMDTLGPDALYAELERQDPEYAMTITRHDRHKIVRALEILHTTGKKVSSIEWKKKPTLNKYDFRCWFLHRPRHRIYHRIEKRCEKMVHDGFLDEVKRLKEQGLLLNNSAAQAIGYRQALEYLSSDQSRCSYNHFLERFKQVTRHYAKRQDTWFRRESYTRLDMDALDPETAMAIIACDFKADRR